MAVTDAEVAFTPKGSNDSVPTTLDSSHCARIESNRENYLILRRPVTGISLPFRYNGMITASHPSGGWTKFN